MPSLNGSLPIATVGLLGCQTSYGFCDPTSSGSLVASSNTIQGPPGLYDLQIQLSAVSSYTIVAKAQFQSITVAIGKKTEVGALPGSPTPAPPDNKVVIAVSVVCVLVGVILILGVIIFILWRRRKSARVQDVVGQDPDRMRDKCLIAFSELFLEKSLGTGSFGEVFEGTYRGTPVAVKRLRKQDFDAGQLQMFEAEVSVLGNMRHPNCVMFYGACLESPNVCIVTELMSHGSLYDTLHQDTELDNEIRLSFCLDAAMGMNYLHSQVPPLLHRDVKSPNFMVDANLHLKVSDFGLRVMKDEFDSVKALADHRAAGTSVGILATKQGSMYWMAPEIAQGAEYTAKADVFSYGIMLWEIWSRQVPYNGDNPKQVLAAVTSDNLRPDMGTIKEAPGDLQKMMQRCWHKNPDERPTFKMILAEVQSMHAKLVPNTKNASFQVRAPIGLVTLVFTDVQDSTKLWESFPEVMKNALRAHNNTMRSVIVEHKGYEVKTEGDAFMIAFHTTLDAAAFCMAAQVKLLAADWPTAPPDHPVIHEQRNAKGDLLWRGLRVRMGIHTGRPTCQPDSVTRRMDYYGPVVNKSARVASAAQGGQIVMSADAYNDIKGHEAPLLPHTVVNLGEMNLKGITEPEHLYELRSTQVAERSFEVKRGGRPDSPLMVPTTPGGGLATPSGIASLLHSRQSSTVMTMPNRHSNGALPTEQIPAHRTTARRPSITEHPTPGAPGAHPPGAAPPSPRKPITPVGGDVRTSATLATTALSSALPPIGGSHGHEPLLTATAPTLPPVGGAAGESRSGAHVLPPISPRDGRTRSGSNAGVEGVPRARSGSTSSARGPRVAEETSGEERPPTDSALRPLAGPSRPLQPIRPTSPGTGATGTASADTRHLDGRGPTAAGPEKLPNVPVARPAAPPAVARSPSLHGPAFASSEDSDSSGGRH